MQFPIPICAVCKFFNNTKWNCKAFPKGMPNEILIGENNHREPLPKQGNIIVFTKKES